MNNERFCAILLTVNLIILTNFTNNTLKFKINNQIKFKTIQKEQF